MNHVRRRVSADVAKSSRFSDARGVVQLATHAAVEASRVVEGVHQSVLGTIGFPAGRVSGQTRGVTGLVYRSVRSVAHWLGRGTDALLSDLQHRFETHGNAEPLGGAPGSAKREAILAALNGVMGDRLAEIDSPFATPMSLRFRGAPVVAGSLKTGEVNGKIVLLIHGLCMNDLQWQTECNGQLIDYGQILASGLGYTPLYLRYNSGRHVSENGRALALQLEHLLASWPCPIEEISVVAHSMGGLVIRSAADQASQAQLVWRQHLKSIVFLGTPHHGAPLERGGNIIDALLGFTPYTAPFARLGRLRSAGITDLRYGNVLDEDWIGQDRFLRQADSRRFLCLPEDIACYAVAASTAARRSLLADRLIGDGLVPLRSALGEHSDKRRTLHFPKSAQWIGYRMGHNALLSSPDVSKKLMQWLGSTSKLERLPLV